MGRGGRVNADETREWYERYYRARGADRNDALNPERWFQLFATSRALRQVLVATGVRPAEVRVLDIGCGTGNSLLEWIELGALPDHLTGVDIQPERIAQARVRLPSVDLRTADATALEFPDGAFDVVTASTMFCQITDDATRRAIAREMVRVTRPGGLLIITDWLYSRPGDREMRSVGMRDLQAMFGPGAQLAARRMGALAPPLGRFLSKRAPALFTLAGYIPGVAAQAVSAWRRTGA